MTLVKDERVVTLSDSNVINAFIEAGWVEQTVVEITEPVKAVETPRPRRAKNK